MESFEATRRDAVPERENCITPGAPLCLNARYAETLKVLSHKVIGESDILLVTARTTLYARRFPKTIPTNASRTARQKNGWISADF